VGVAIKGTLTVVSHVAFPKMLMVPLRLAPVVAVISRWVLVMAAKSPVAEMMVNLLVEPSSNHPEVRVCVIE
jgi:hypothetical protein